MEAVIPVAEAQIPEVATVASAAVASPKGRSSGNRTSAEFQEMTRAIGLSSIRHNWN